MTTTIIKSDKISPETVAKITSFIKACGGGGEVPAKYDVEEFSSDLIRSILKVQHIHRGRVTCILTVKPCVLNPYNTFHGGAVGSTAEFVAIACARTVVNKDKELFLGELSISLLAAAVKNAELIVDASILRSGRNLTVVSIEFKSKDSGRLNYLCRATFYNMPVASL